MKHHYFIAIVPEPKLCDAITTFKTELFDLFGTRQSLKSPPHITLQMPFFREPEEEKKLEDMLEDFAEQEKPFTVDLNGFDVFAPRVIFVKVKDHSLLIKLHQGLKSKLKNELDFLEKELTLKIHPHMTIAHHDLKENDFPKAWSMFSKREFNASFEVTSFSLLKHNGKNWDVYKEFYFRQDR